MNSTVEAAGQHDVKNRAIICEEIPHLEKCRANSCQLEPVECSSNENLIVAPQPPPAESSLNVSNPLFCKTRTTQRLGKFHSTEMNIGECQGVDICNGSSDTVSHERPPLRSELSEPITTCLSINTAISPRCKRDSLSGKSLSAFRGTEPHSVSYASYNLKGNFDLLTGGVPQHLKHAAASSSLEDSWKSLYSALLTSEAVANRPVTIRNPNKAILTIESPSSKVLIANDIACRLFGVGNDQLVGKHFTKLLASGAKHFTTSGPSVADRCFASDSTDELLPVYGKVVEIVDSSGSVVPVSFWVQPISPSSSSANTSSTPTITAGDNKNDSSCTTSTNSDRWLAVLEPVERFSASCTLSPQGRVFTCDDKVADLFGYNSSSEILGSSIADLVPALVFPRSKLDTDHFKQNLTGRFRSGTSFPVSVKIAPAYDRETSELLKYDATFHVYTTISGLITVLPDGNIHSCNNNFVSTLFGYRQEQLMDKSIETIIPKFYQEIMPVDDGDYPFYEFSSDFSGSQSSQKPALKKTNSELAGSNPASGEFLSPQRLSGIFTPKLSPFAPPSLASTPRLNSATTDISIGSNQQNSKTSIDAKASFEDAFDNCSRMPEGSFWGFGRHRDGCLIAIGYQIRRVIFKDGSILYCLWIVRDPESHLSPHFNLGSRRGSDSTSTLNDVSVQGVGDLNLNSNNANDGKFEAVDPETCEFVRGEYSLHYYTLQQIGKGSFGCVKMAARKSDNVLVLTKFIKKEAVLHDSWVLDKKLGRIPIEISLLSSLKHPNIVQVLAVYQNEKYFQMVMEKHGEGMDLFEFIDREPHMDEYLASFIFRQVVSAVSYLHSKHILHRDLKDENVIINDRFLCKIIDFGSAAFMQSNKLFSTFCGTMEYCSPEVLLGNRYAGPELEMWSLGILLYTLIFYENPFHSVEETIAAELDPPWEVSEGLYNLLCWLLHPSPVYRATIAEVERHFWVCIQVDIFRYRFSDVLQSTKRDDRDLSQAKLLDNAETEPQSSPANLFNSMEKSIANQTILPLNHTF